MRAKERYLFSDRTNNSDNRFYKENNNSATLINPNLNRISKKNF